MIATDDRSTLRLFKKRATLHQSVVLSLLGVVGFVVAAILVKRGVTSALALVLLPGVCLILLRSWGGVLLGVALILTVPSWYTLGSAQLSIVRVASFLAASSCVVALVKRRRIPLRGTDIALAVYVAVVTLGWLLQYDQPHVGRIVTTEFTPVGFYVGARVIPAAKVRFVLLTVLIAGTVGSLTVLYEFARGQVVFANPQTYGLWGGGAGLVFRPGGIFGNAPEAATVLGSVIVLGLAWLRLCTGRLRVLVVVCLVICTSAVGVTFTRASMIGAGVGVATFILLTRPSAVRPLRLAWLALIVWVAVFAALPGLQGNATFQEGIVRPDSLASRESVWSLAWPIATSSPHHLVLGVGTGVLEAPDATNTAALSPVVAAAPLTYTLGIQNQYLVTLVENGLVGLASLLILMGSGLVPAARAARARRDPVRAALAATVVGLMVVMVANTALFGQPVFAVLLLVLGLATNLASSSTDSGSRPVMVRSRAGVGAPWSPLPHAATRAADDWTS